MRDYALHRAEAMEMAGPGAWLRRLIGNWRARRAVARLDRLDDFLLRDIGVSRPDTPGHRTQRYVTPRHAVNTSL